MPKKNKKSAPLANKKDALAEGLYFIPLGGSEQFGVNLNVYACDGEYIAVDCGIGFADERMPGIDIMLPDPAFLEAHRKNLKALIITHAHEDHVGAVAYLWERLKCPIYTTPFTAAVLEEKFHDRQVRGPSLNICAGGESVKIGAFDVQFVPVSHSVPDTCALSINTPYGRVLHSADWNLDSAPTAGYVTSADDFKKIGAKGILAYVGDSTNAEVPGVSGSESEIESALVSEFKKCKGRIAITIFSSNIGRIKSIARAAKKCGRHVGVVGRSLHRMVGVAAQCGYMRDMPEFLSEEEIGALPGHKVVMVVTGSQGEPRSALAKIARREMRGVRMERGDTVIFSARPIPGNEKNINAVKNNLSAHAIQIITPNDTDNKIHVSGHPCRDEIAQMYDWLKPALVIPVHGERTNLEAQAALARSCGIGQTIVPSNGSVIRLAPGTPAVVDTVKTGLLAVDQKRVISGDHASISERRKLQYSGAVHVSLVVDEKGRILGDPCIDMVGLVDESEEHLYGRLYDQIDAAFGRLNKKERQDDDAVADEISHAIRRFVNHTLGIKPLTTVHVLRV